MVALAPGHIHELSDEHLDAYADKLSTACSLTVLPLHVQEQFLRRAVVKDRTVSSSEDLSQEARLADLRARLLRATDRLELWKDASTPTDEATECRGEAPPTTTTCLYRADPTLGDINCTVRSRCDFPHKEVLFAILTPLIREGEKKLPEAGLVAHEI